MGQLTGIGGYWRLGRWWLFSGPAFSRDMRRSPARFFREKFARRRWDSATTLAADCLRWLPSPWAHWPFDLGLDRHLSCKPGHFLWRAPCGFENRGGAGGKLTDGRNSRAPGKANDRQ